MSSLRLTPSRLECLRTMRALQRYLDGALDETARRRVAAHLERCRRCGLEAEVYREIKAALADGDRSLDPAAMCRLRRFGEQLARDAEVAGREPDA